jgi:glycosyltransferase involved in cell wall biosynthesis
VNERGSDNQTVSVIVPTYYRNDRLERALRSVSNQRYEPVEVIVVDDSGEAHAESVVDQFDDVRYVAKDANEGPQVARTIGIRQSSGAFVQLLDDDDRLLKRKIERQVELLNENEGTGVAYCGFTWDDGTTVLPKRHVRGDVLRETLTFDTAPCITSTMLIETSVLKQCLPLVDRSGGDDTGLKIELAKRTNFDYIDEALVSRTNSADSRQSSTGKIEAQKRIIEEYRDLYEQYPAAVYREAMAETYLIDGLGKLDERVWSVAAIVSIGKALYLSPSFSLPILGALVACLFGRPGRDLGHRVFQTVRGDDRRGKSL